VLGDRLEREAQVIRKLRHKNIIPLLATEGSSLIYPYNDGVSLAEVLQRGVLPPRKAVRIISDILSALVYTHAHGVIHCDVKPANIILQGNRALLTDFGFAKDLALKVITQPGTFFGTPNYMPPEQFHGKRDDPRNDIYAAGAVLYHMLVGEPPYGNQVIRFLLGDDSLVLSPLPEPCLPLREVVATALARDAFYLPTYAEVMAEVPTVEVPAPVSSQASGSSPVQPPSKRRCLGEQQVVKSQFGIRAVCLIQARAFFYHPAGPRGASRGP
jgi:serine/threonine-protein kinase